MSQSRLGHFPKAESRRDTPPPDEALMVRLTHGSEEAATQLYRRYAHRLRALVRARCSGELSARLDVDDIVQSVLRSFFHSARRGLYSVPPGEELWKILLVIALNKIRSAKAFHRAARRDVRLTARADDCKEALSNLARGKAADSLLRLAVREALDRFPAQHRRMIELRIHGHGIKDIAVATGRSKRSVERVLQEARNKLQTIFYESR